MQMLWWYICRWKNFTVSSIIFGEWIKKINCQEPRTKRFLPDSHHPWQPYKHTWCGRENWAWWPCTSACLSLERWPAITKSSYRGYSLYTTLIFRSSRNCLLVFLSIFSAPSASASLEFSLARCICRSAISWVSLQHTSAFSFKMKSGKPYLRHVFGCLAIWTVRAQF